MTFKKLQLLNNMNADSECPTFDNTVVNDIRNIENGNGEYGLEVFNYDEPNDVSGWGIILLL